jgi:DNA polymerase-3 subunit beta
MSGESLTAEILKESLRLTAEGFSSQIAALNARDFPPVVSTLTDKAVVLPETFLSAVNNLLFATSTDEARPVLKGVLFLVTERGLTCVSSDGFRLSKYELDVPEATITKLGVNDRFIIPKGALSEFVKLAGESGAVTLEKRGSEGQVLMGTGDSIIASRIIEGQFPDFARIIPKNSKVTVSISRSDFLESLKRAAIFARDSGNTVYLSVNADGIILSAESQLVGKQESVLSAKVDGGETRVAFNYKYIEDFLMSGTSESITMKMTDESSAGVFINPEDPAFLHLIMPVRA